MAYRRIEAIDVKWVAELTLDNDPKRAPESNELPLQTFSVTSNTGQNWFQNWFASLKKGRKVLKLV